MIAVTMNHYLVWVLSVYSQPILLKVQLPGVRLSEIHCR